MKEIFGDIWDLADQYDAVCITTNGWIKSNGHAVMGRGIAKEALERYPGIDWTLGYKLREGNYPHILVHGSVAYREPTILSFPVKPRYGPNGEMGWKAKAEIQLIRESAEIIVDITDQYSWDRVLLPRPGCGNGGLHWEQVKPVIEPIFDDRFTVVTWQPNVWV